MTPKATIKLPWPSPILSPNDRSHWAEEDDQHLKDMHGTIPLAELADAMGRTRSSLRARVTRLGLSKRVFWAEDEIAALKSAYIRAGRDGVVDLNGLAKSLRRHKTNVCRKARELGLETNKTRKVVEQRKPKKVTRKYKNEDERSAARSETLRQRHAKNGHPMQGKRHTQEALVKISRASKAHQLMLSPEEKSARVIKAMKTKVRNGLNLSPRVARGSWKAGWREIGGKRNYYRSRWEANYARYLQWLKEHEQIVDWQHEPETFWFESIRRGVRSYKPDFRVWENNGRSDLHEVKGWMDSRSKTCLKRMAKYHPNERVILIDGHQYRAIRLKVMRLIADWEDSERDTHA